MNAYNIISIVCQVYHSGLYIIGNIMYDSSRSVLPVYMIKMTYLKSCVGLEKLDPIRNEKFVDYLMVIFLLLTNIYP